MWEKRNPSTVRGNVNWNSHCRKQHGDNSNLKKNKKFKKKQTNNNNNNKNK